VVKLLEKTTGTLKLRKPLVTTAFFNVTLSEKSWFNLFV